MDYKKIYVVVFQVMGAPPEYYFCASDKDRIIFFKEIKLDSIPSSNIIEPSHPMIVVLRNNDIIDAGSCGWIDEEDFGVFFGSLGLDKIREEARVYDITANDSHILKADWFQENDCIEIRNKIWGDTSWLSQVTTSRVYGAKFKEVFPKNSSVWKMLPRCLFKKYTELEEKTVIFEGQQPIIRELKKFF